MDIAKQPGIDFKTIILTKESFSREKDIQEDMQIDVNFKMNFIKIEGTKDFNMELCTNLNGVKDGIKLLTLESTFVGVFSYIDGAENLDMDDFAKNNSPAIMFPFIREHIATITQKAGVGPILLAPINVVALLQNQENKN